MRDLRIASAVVLVLGCGATCGLAAAAENPSSATADYVRDPLPPGFQVVTSDLEGLVFADAAGHTLYVWPRQSLRNAFAGEDRGEVNCYDVHYRVTAGIIANPYPAGNELPDADTRPTCVQHWPPVIAASDAKPIGNWSILARTDGKKQWAYKGRALYTWHLDQQLGETSGGNSRDDRDMIDGGARRRPAGPDWAIPPQFLVAHMVLGQMLMTVRGFSVYSFDNDTPTQSNCNGSCLEEWAPMLASELAVAQGQWSIVQRQGGARQWALRGRPLYTHITDSKQRSYEGGDLPGWHNVFLHRTPPPPRPFRFVDTRVGQVIAEAHGKTIYYYTCIEDTVDQLNCDETDSPQVYRWAMCGAGDPVRCLKTFPYVMADKGAKSNNVAWSTVDIDPKTGRSVAAGTPGSLHVWAYQRRPIYTFAGDREVGDIGADGWGEDRGEHNGFSGIWVRDDYSNLDGTPLPFY